MAIQLGKRGNRGEQFTCSGTGLIPDPAKQAGRQPAVRDLDVQPS